MSPARCEQKVCPRWAEERCTCGFLCAERAEQVSGSGADTAATLTPAILRHALDELWRGTPLRLSPREQAEAEAARVLAAAVPDPDPDWAVTADGWRLVIYDGAIAGISQEGG